MITFFAFFFLRCSFFFLFLAYYAGSLSMIGSGTSGVILICGLFCYASARYAILASMMSRNVGWLFSMRQGLSTEYAWVLLLASVEGDINFDSSVLSITIL